MCPREPPGWWGTENRDRGGAGGEMACGPQMCSLCPGFVLGGDPQPRQEGRGRSWAETGSRATLRSFSPFPLTQTPAWPTAHAPVHSQCWWHQEQGRICQLPPLENSCAFQPTFWSAVERAVHLAMAQMNPLPRCPSPAPPPQPVTAGVWQERENLRFTQRDAELIKRFLLLSHR